MRRIIDRSKRWDSGRSDRLKKRAEFDKEQQERIIRGEVDFTEVEEAIGIRDKYIAMIYENPVDGKKPPSRHIVEVDHIQSLLKDAMDLLSRRGVRVFDQNRETELGRPVLASDLKNGEYGYGLAWMVGKENTIIKRKIFGTACIRVWRDKNGKLHWDKKAAKRYLDRNK